MGPTFPDRLKFAGEFRITNVIRVKVGDAYSDTVFHFAFAEIVQLRTPTRILF